MGFPPNGAPPLELTFLPKAGSERGVKEGGLRGEPLGGKPSVPQVHPVADEQPRRKLKEKGDQKKKGKPRKWFPFFLCSPPVCLYMLKRSYTPEPKLYS